MPWLNAFWFLVSCVVLVLSSTALIRSIEKISVFMKVKIFVISFLILGVGTSIPELFVGINAAIQGNPELSLSNIVGANFLNITLIIGIPILIFRGIRVQSKEERKDILYMLICVLMPMVMLSIDNRISRLEGALLIGLFLLYNYNLLREEKAFHKKVSESLRHYMVLLHFLAIASCLILLYYSSRSAIHYAIRLATDLQLSTVLVGLIIISLGTTLPELMVSIRSLMSAEKEMMVGNIIGSLVANSTLILGVVALMHPIELSFSLVLMPVIFLIFAIFLFMAFAENGRMIGVSQGIVFVFLYIMFLIIELGPGGFRAG